MPSRVEIAMLIYCLITFAGIAALMWVLLGDTFIERMLERRKRRGDRQRLHLPSIARQLRAILRGDL